MTIGRRSIKEGKAAKKEEKLTAGSVRVTFSDKRKQKKRMETKEEKDLWIEEKSHLKEGEVETGEGVGRGGDHPLHPPGGRGQETEGGDHGVRFLSPNPLAVLISKYKPTFFSELGSLKPNMAEALVETTSDLANMVKGSPSQYVKVEFHIMPLLK